MISKTAAEQVLRAAMNSISELSALLRDLKESCSDEDFERFRRGIGLSIGTIQVEVMDPVYAHYPELDDLT
jgi:hypothetical protein